MMHVRAAQRTDSNQGVDGGSLVCPELTQAA